MGLVSKTKTFSSGETIEATDHNSNFDTLYTLVNGNIEDSNIKSSAGIAESKITFSATGHAHAGGTDGQQVQISSLTITSQTAGDIIYYTGTAWARLGTGANGYILCTTGGTIAWVSP